MEKRKAAAVIDNVFLVLAIWLMSYLWTRYYVMNLLVALISASSIAMLVIMLINLKRKKTKRDRLKEKRADNIMNQFLYGGKDFSLDFLFLALKKRFEVEIFKQDNLIRYKRTVVLPRFVAHPLSLEELIECYVAAKKAGARRMLLLSIHGIDKQARLVLPRLPDMEIVLMDRMKSYDFLGWLGAFPEVKISLYDNKPSLKSLLKSAIAPSKFKHYLMISLVLMISSYFVMYSVYYIVAATIAFSLAILSKLDLVKRTLKKD